MDIHGISFLIAITQGLGLLGMALDLYGAIHKSDRRMVWCFVIGSFFFVAHFVLLGAWPAAVSEFITAVRFYLSRVYRKNWIFWFFILLYAGMGIFFSKDIFGVLPFCASILGTIGVFRFYGIKMRWCFIGGETLWLIYGFHVMSLGVIAMNGALLVITLTTIWRIKKSPP